MAFLDRLAYKNPKAKLKKADKAREYGAKAAALSPGYKPYVDNLVNGL